MQHASKDSKTEAGRKRCIWLRTDNEKGGAGRSEILKLGLWAYFT